MNNKHPKPWLCPSCGHTIGEVIFGELHINGNATLNTDGQNIVIMCQSCGSRKVWFVNDRMTQFAREIAEHVLRASQS